ncbi:MAG: AAA family ATPase [Candidatus Eremiobacterota bacterium]
MSILRPPPEQLFATELEALARDDASPRPPGWKLSPRAVREFLCGANRKFYGDDVLVERAVVSLAGNRGLLLVGEPGTAKSMLSELLAAAISGTSTNAIQGGSGTTEDQVKYTWNYALLLSEGPSPRALVPSPLYVAMRDGVLLRFEEITRCPPEIQDQLISVMSDKVLMVPELEGEARVLYARPGFNVVATANLRDRGVHEMSSALKRRFNFETVHPIADLQEEVELVLREAGRLLQEAGAPVAPDPSLVEVLVTAFRDLRSGETAEGTRLEKPSAVMSTAEAVSVALAAGLDAYYFDGGRLQPAHLARHLASAVQKDNPEDLPRLTHYFDVVVRERARRRGGPWSELLAAKKFVR